MRIHPHIAMAQYPGTLVINIAGQDFMFIHHRSIES